MANSPNDPAIKVEYVQAASLKFHRRNYKQHPPDQLMHIMQSIKEHGFYRTIVVARDDVILAGHGVVQAAVQMGLTEVPIIRLDLDPEGPRALKIMTSDNEIARLGEVDDRALTELLKEIMQADDLLGTGFDEQQLAALLMVTRPREEIAGFDAAQEWVGMPSYDPGTQQIQLIVSFRTAEDRQAFIAASGVGLSKRMKTSDDRVWSGWWPPMERADRSSLRFEEEQT